jgi:hypothetical protein
VGSNPGPDFDKRLDSALPHLGPKYWSRGRQPVLNDAVVAPFRFAQFLELSFSDGR